MRRRAHTVERDLRLLSDVLPIAWDPDGRQKRRYHVARAVIAREALKS